MNEMVPHPHTYHLIKRWLCQLLLVNCQLVAACILIIGCTNNSSRDPKLTQYYNQGEELYLQHCSNCHQKNGKGLGRVYPPLDSSDFVATKFEEVICLIENGKKGSILVNGVEFNQAMPGIPTLTDLEIAEITTYLYNNWNRNRGIVEVKEVTRVLSSCKTNP